MLGLLLKVSKLANVDVDWVSERTACWRHGYGQWSCDEHCLYCHAHYTLFNHGLSACRQLRDSLYYASVHCQYHRSVQRVTGPYPPPLPDIPPNSSLRPRLNSCTAVAPISERIIDASMNLLLHSIISLLRDGPKSAAGEVLYTVGSYVKR